VDLEFDAGLITWVATANDPARIPRTLLSRMKCFWIGMPNAEQAMLIVQAVAAHAVKDAGVPGFITPSRTLLSEIAHYSARQIYQIVSEVIARCVTEGRKQMTLADLERWVYRDEEDPDSKGGEGKGGEGKERVTLH
jgi:ATP-dependent Lon protease